MKKIITVFAIIASTMSFSQVGIGTSTPSAKSILDLTATDKGFLLPRMTTAQRVAIAPNNTTDIGMQVYDTVTLSIWYWNGTAWVQQGVKNIYDSNGDVAPAVATNRTVGFTNGGSLNFDANTLFVDATNNRVGIGTTTPFGFLHINRTGNPSGIVTSYVDGIVLSANSSGPGGGLSGPGFYFESLNANVGQRLLKVNYALNVSNEAYLNFQAVSDNGGAAVRDVMSIFHNGRVGIGTFNPLHPLQMGSGAHVTTAGVWTNASDSRLKSDILATNYGLAEVLKLRPVQYTMNIDKSKQVGFIAQEVQKIIPEVVSGIEGDISKGETLGVSYGNLVPVLTKAIQELNAKIEKLAKENEELKTELVKNNNLNATIERIESELRQLKLDVKK